jgi:DnaK suppressor protein
MAQIVMDNRYKAIARSSDVSKTSAKSPAIAKPAGGRKAAAAAPAPAPKAAAKASAKPVPVKSSPKPAPAPSTSARPAPAKSTSAKPAPAKAAPAKAAPIKTAPAQPVPAKTAPASPTPASLASAKPMPASPVAAKPPPAKAPARASTKAAPAKSATPTPPPQPISRFAERFAPPRPPARGFPEPMEMVRAAVKADPKLVNAWKSKAGRDLSEAELLAMPEDEYMNEKQLEFFRVRLQALKDDLLSNAGETTEHLREDTSIVPDPADRATIEEEHALELRTRDRERKLLKKISQSLARIEAGDYGFCDETGEPIGLGRLMARPTATLSLEAQQRRELKQKMFGD